MTYRAAMFSRGIAAAAVLVIMAAPASHAASGRTVPMPTVWGAVGDSITGGGGASAPAHAYPAVAGVPAIGHSGQCLVQTICHQPSLVEQFPSELATLQAAGVNAVVVEIGINDLASVRPRARFVAAYLQLQAQGAAVGVRVVLSTITPFGPDHLFVAGQEWMREKVNRWIRRHQTSYVDYAAALGGDTLEAAYDSGDHVHPSDAGHAALAAALDRFITAAATPKPGRPMVCVRAPCYNTWAD